MVCISDQLIWHHDPINFPTLVRPHPATHADTLPEKAYNSCSHRRTGRLGGDHRVRDGSECHANNSRAAAANGCAVINVQPRSRHLTPGGIPGVMGSSWSEASGRTAEKKQSRRRQTRAALSSPPSSSPRGPDRPTPPADQEITSA